MAGERGIAGEEDEVGALFWGGSALCAKRVLVGPSQKRKKGVGGERKEKKERERGLTTISRTKARIRSVKVLRACRSSTSAFNRIQTRRPVPPPAPGTVHVRGAHVSAARPAGIIVSSSSSSCVVQLRHTFPRKRPSNSASSRSGKSLGATSANQVPDEDEDDDTSRSSAGRRSRSCSRASSSPGEEERGREGACILSSRSTAAWSVQGVGAGCSSGARESARSAMAALVQG